MFCKGAQQTNFIVWIKICIPICETEPTSIFKSGVRETGQCAPSITKVSHGILRLVIEWVIIKLHLNNNLFQSKGTMFENVPMTKNRHIIIRLIIIKNALEALPSYFKRYL